jgi:hypothetical protein
MADPVCAFDDDAIAKRAECRVHKQARAQRRASVVTDAVAGACADLYLLSPLRLLLCLLFLLFLLLCLLFEVGRLPSASSL